MQIRSAVFVKGIVDPSTAFDDGIPHVALIGRSNVGKSTTVNVLTKQKQLAKTSATPGRTRQINLFLINNNFYLADLPGYGYARGSHDERDVIKELIGAYLFTPGYTHRRVIQIMDAVVGPTELDLEILHALEASGKSVIVALNKIDKVPKSRAKHHIDGIKKIIGDHDIVPYSAEHMIGIADLVDAIERT